MKKMKKGFTIVELVIVIAVIAILAGVLIPVFSNVVDKANKSKDTQLVRNLNEALAVDLDEHNTMYDALQAAKEFGYDVGKINASATDNEILWDSKNDAFVYLNGGNLEYIPGFEAQPVADHELWIISNTVSTKYSTYYTGNDTEVTVETGFDAGEKTGIKVNVATDETITLTVRTTSKNDVVTATAPNATINFYGFAGEFDVISVDDENCLHVFGQVDFLKVAAGKVKAENNAVIKAIHIADNDATIEINAQAVVETVTASSGVTLDGEKIKGVELNEIIENVNPDEAQTGATLFAGGFGTETAPYLVEDRTQFENISRIADYSYYKWVGESVVDASNWSKTNTLVGSFDGNGVKFNNIDCALFSSVWNGTESGHPSADTVNEYAISNLTVNANIVRESWTSAVVYTAGVHNLVMKNVTVNGYIEGSAGVASFICFGAGNYATEADGWCYDGIIKFINCKSDATIVAKSGNAVGFIAHAMTKTSNARVELVDSDFNGILSAPSNASCKYINGNWINATIVDDQSEDKNGVVYNSKNNGYTYIATGKVGSFTIEQGVLPESIGDAFVVDAKAGATKATISLIVSPNPGCFTQTCLSEEVDVVNGKVVSNEVRYFNIRINASGITDGGINGNNFDIVNSLYNGELGANTVVRITQYSTNGDILGIINISFGDK